MLRGNRRDQRGGSFFEYTLLLLFALIATVWFGGSAFHNLDRSWNAARDTANTATGSDSAHSQFTAALNSGLSRNEAADHGNRSTEQHQTQTLDWKSFVLVGLSLAFVVVVKWILLKG